MLSTDTIVAEVSDAQERTERPADPDRPRHPDGPDVPVLLAARLDGVGAAGERMSAGAGEDPVRATARLPRHRRPLRPHRRVLRSPRRLALVRPQRGARAALPLSRLEVRRDRA